MRWLINILFLIIGLIFGFIINCLLPEGLKIIKFKPEIGLGEAFNGIATLIFAAITLYLAIRVQHFFDQQKGIKSILADEIKFTTQHIDQIKVILLQNLSAQTLLANEEKLKIRGNLIMLDYLVNGLKDQMDRELKDYAAIGLDPLKTTVIKYWDFLTSAKVQSKQFVVDEAFFQGFCVIHFTLQTELKKLTYQFNKL